MSSAAEYAVCKCGCDTFSSWLTITSKGKEIVFVDKWRCDDCGAVFEPDLAK